MYRLLIVDDEYHIVDWLTELFLEQKKVELEIYRAYLAREALDILDQVKIDVVLSDIRMPGIDGFELADRIRDNWPEARIIFLTGYNDFDYAYRANQYQNIRYLLKTEDDDVILETVYSAIRSLTEERKNLKKLDEYDWMQKLVEYQVQKNLMMEFLDRGKPEKLLQAGLKFDYQEELLLLGIHIETAQEDYLEAGKFILRLSDILKQLTEVKVKGFVIGMEQGYYLWLVQPGCQKDLRNALLFIKEMLEDLSGACLDNLGCQAFFTLYGEPVIWGKVKEKYDLLRFSLEDMAKAGEVYGGRILGKEEEAELAEKNGSFLKERELKKNLAYMQGWLEQGKKEDFFAGFTSIYNDMIQIRNRHYYPAIEIFQSLSAMYLSYINRKNLIEKLAFKIALSGLFQVYEFDNWKEAFDYLKKLGEYIFEEAEAQQGNRNGEFVEKITRFVRDNLGDNLSLTYIARHLNYNPSYVSRLFKQLEGRNLSDYINECRMEYARKRLRESQDTIAVIAEECGFESSQYFSAAFKKYCHMTPGDYRHMAETQTVFSKHI